MNRNLERALIVLQLANADLRAATNHLSGVLTRLEAFARG